MTDNTKKGPEVHTQSMYWDTYTEDQKRALLSLPPNDLSGEITLLRILILHLLQQEMKTPPTDPRLSFSSLQAKCAAALTIASMQNIQIKERIAHPWWKPILDEAYHQARLELGVYDYLERAERPS
jgi:hypothetical protein